MSGSDSDRWGRREPRYGGTAGRDVEPPGPAGDTVRQDQTPDQTIARVAEVVVQLQSQLDRMAHELSSMQTHVKQAGIDAEEAITAALEDILARIDRGVETTNDDKHGRALDRVQERIDELVARDRDGEKASREDEIGPVLARLEEAVSGMAAKAELDQDMVDALTRIETAISGQGDEARYERRSVVVRLDQLLEAVQSSGAQSESRPADSSDRDQLMAKLDGLAEQVEAVRHRVTLRARPDAVTLDEATVSAIGDAVARAFAAALTNRGGASPKPPTADRNDERDESDH